MLLASPRVIALVAAICALTSSIFADDESFGKLREARLKYEKTYNEVSASIEKWFDGLEDRARQRGDRQAILVLNSGRQSLRKTGIIPADAPAPLVKKMDTAASRLKKDYGIVIADLTRQRLDGPANAASRELAAILSGANRLDWHSIFSGGKLDPEVSVADFIVVDGLLSAPGDHDKLLFYMKPMKNFRARLRYRIDEQAEAAIVFRCPNPRVSREVGYSVGLGSNKEWIYDINRSYNFVYMATATSLILDATLLPTHGVVSTKNFHVLEVIAIDNKFRVILDSQNLYEFSANTHPEGVLGLHNRRGRVEIESFDYALLP